LNHRFKVTEKLTLQSGARYSHYGINATFDTTFFKFPFTDVYLNSASLTGSLGAVFIPEKTWILSLNTATGFRAPNIDDMGKVFDSNPGSVVVPNPNLKSEYSYNIDLGLAKVIAKRVKLDVTGFYTYLDNALARTRYQFNGQDSVLYNGVLSQVEAITNTSYGEVIGIQAGIDIALPAGFTIASKFNWMKGTEYYPNGSSSRLNHTPPNFGISRLSYRRKKLMAEVYIQYNGKVLNKDLSIGEATTEYLMAKDSEGKPWFPNWMTWNFKTSYHFNSFISLSGGVENITDLRYRPYGSGISAPGRNFILALRGSF
jgi:hemoglobin/transferrin/lactoferrin receptor protein